MQKTHFLNNLLFTFSGNSLRNIRAFDVLQQTFINCNTASLLRTILEVISTIYNADVSNFFILYNQKTLVAFAHVIPNKSQEVWAHYFDLLDFVATTLRFVPILELITLSSHLETRRYAKKPDKITGKEKDQLPTKLTRTISLLLKNIIIFQIYEWGKKEVK